MAMASTSTSLGSPEEKTNGFKLMKLIIDLGTEALRNEFKKKHPGNLHTVLSINQPTLHRLKIIKNVIGQHQWDKLYPPVPMIPNIKEFDITLLAILLRNICGIPRPSTGWDKMPNYTDTSLGANIVRIKLLRNKFFAHITETGVSTTEFKACWKEVSTTLVNLGISQADIDRVEDEESGQEEVDRIRREWAEKEARLALQLLGIKKILLNIQSDVKSMISERSSTDNINLSKYLDSCNFDTDIELLNQKWCKDTREWVFEQVSDWLNDATSDSRAFIITGQAGMGKSVIAAVICKRFTKQLAACHFCQYNNDRYNNPKILLQSLAKQLSNVIPEYRKALIEKLSGKERQRLDDMNIQGSFSLLFKEPLAGIQVAERYLIVIDAIDESQHEGKSDIVDLIADYLGQLPCFIRFIITTRPEKNITKKFENLKPMFLSPSDKQNVRDIQCFFETKLSCSQEANQISRLVEKSEGLILFANCLLDLFENGSFKLEIHDLPSGIEKIYESYFKRWENEFQIVGVEDKDFLTFLSVMAVAKQPLPEALVERVFDFDNNSSAIAKRKMKEIKNCLSLLILTQQGRLTFFHKSVKDWLVESEHDFTVDEKVGNETLAIICAMEMDEIKKNGIKPPFHSAAEYALLYGTQHKLAGTQGTLLETFVNRYVTDLEIMYACVTVDVYTLFSNLVGLKNNAVYTSLPKETRKIVETLMLLIRKYIRSLKDFPQSFLQRVVNWREDDLSSKAASLLKHVYPKHVYFELTEKDDFQDSSVGRIHLSGYVRYIDISPSEDHVVCFYHRNKIELFSLIDFKSLWKIKRELELPDFEWDQELYRCIVFHPLKNFILAGMLDPVINLRGNFEPGPFLCKKINPRFYNCCFSNDRRKMATTYKGDLTVWNLVSNEKLKSFSSNKALISVLFSANSRFLATTDVSNTVVVYDLEKDFISISKSFNQRITLVSTFEAGSWYCERGCFQICDMCTLRSDLFVGNVDFDFWIYRQCIPLNVKAAAEFEGAMKNRKKSWLSKFHSILFFCLDNGIALVVTELAHNVLELFRISKPKEAQSMTDDPVPYAKKIDFSVDGRFIYATGDDSLWIHKIDCNLSILLLSDLKWQKVQFAPVTNGVFICRKLDNGREWFDTDTDNPRYLNDIPELWNSDLTKRLDSFPDLSGTRYCRSVSKKIVACIMTKKVCFFNVVERKVISETPIPQNRYVVACSSMCHVLMNGERPCLVPTLWQAGEVVAEWKDIFDEPEVMVQSSVFSPSGKTLVLRFDLGKHFLIFNVSPAKLRHTVDFQFFFNYECLLGFLDEDHLLSRAYDKSVCIINVTSGNAITCIDFNEAPWRWCVSRIPDNCSVILCVTTYKQKTNIIKVWLPRQT